MREWNKSFEIRSRKKTAVTRMPKSVSSFMAGFKSSVTKQILEAPIFQVRNIILFTSVIQIIQGRIFAMNQLKEA